MDKRKTFFVPLTFIGVVLSPVFILLLSHFVLMEKSHSPDLLSRLAFASSILCLSLYAIVLIVEFISPLAIKSATFTTAFVALGLFGVMILSDDGANFLRYIGIAIPDWEWFTLLRYWLQFASFLFACTYLFRFAMQDLKVPFAQTNRMVSRLLLVFIFFLFFGLSWLRLQWIAVIAFFIISVYWVAIVALSLTHRNAWTATSLFTFLIFGGVASQILLSSMAYALPQIFTPVIAISAYGVHICLCFFLIYLCFTLFSIRRGYQNEQLASQVEEMQTNILKNQISSHFLFNALSNVKFSYHHSANEGDLALDQLSRFLRSYTEAGDTYLVPLEKELDLLQSYSELYHISHRGIELIFNIESYEYEVPYFSLQPLLENAFHYGGLDQKEGGYVQIDSFEQDGYYHLVFSDNGVGFDTKKIRSESVGIRNVKKRFELLCHATFTLESQEGQGTKITILIPKEKEATS